MERYEAVALCCRGQSAAANFARASFDVATARKGSPAHTAARYRRARGLSLARAALAMLPMRGRECLYLRSACAHNASCGYKLNPRPASIPVRSYTCNLVVSKWYRTGIEVVSNWYRTGIELVSNWYRTGIELVSKWYRSGIELVSNWYRSGIELVSDWYRSGIGLVSNWYRTGIELVSFILMYKTRECKNLFTPAVAVPCSTTRVVR